MVEAGMDGTIAKPFRIKQLVGKINELLGFIEAGEARNEGRRLAESIQVAP